MVVVGGGWLVADAGSLVVVVVDCGSLVLVDGRWLVAGGWLWLVFCFSKKGVANHPIYPIYPHLNV